MAFNRIAMSFLPYFFLCLSDVSAILKFQEPEPLFRTFSEEVCRMSPRKIWFLFFFSFLQCDKIFLSLFKCSLSDMINYFTHVQFVKLS